MLAVGLGCNLVLALIAWWAGAIEWTGALAGIVFGLLVWAGAGWRGWLLLTAFVVLGSVFTRVGARRKTAAGVAHAGRGARTWRNATANCAVGAVCALCPGAAWRCAFVGAFAAALADTTESELGVVLARRTWSPLTRRRVPAGTEGAVSLEGTACGLAAALGLAGLAAWLGLVPRGAVAGVTAGALAATLVESLLGSRWRLSNELLNLVTTAAGAVLAAGCGRWR